MIRLSDMRSDALALFAVFLFSLGCSSPEGHVNKDDALSEESAEREMRQLEELIQNAKTLFVRVRVDHAEESESAWLTTVSTVSFGEGNKSCFTEEVLSVSGGWHHRLISDGSRVQCTTAPGKPMASVAPEELRKNLTAMISRLGVAHFNPVKQILLWGEILWCASEHPSRISRVRSGAVTDEGRELTYVMTVGSGPYSREECSLWYDPKTLRIIKRVWWNPAARFAVTETYEEFVVGGGIPDEQFRLAPNEK